MDRSDRDNQTNRDDAQPRIPGDPGVGGLLTDPLAPPGQHEEPDPTAGPPSPDPEPPRHHGDWVLPHKVSGRLPPSARLASMTWRKSRNGMPRALFRENDGSTLDDLRALASEMRG